METVEVPVHVAVEARLAAVSGHLNVLHAELVTLTRAAIDGRLWEGAGIQSPEQWLAWHAGLAPERAKQIVMIANRQTDLPVTFESFTHGRLSVDQMVVVAKRTPAHNDREACALAQAATVAQLRCVLTKQFLDPPEPDSTDDEAARPAAGSEPEHRVTSGFNDDGDFFLHAFVDSADGAIIHNALTEAKDALFRAGNTAATWSDALVEVCSRSLGAVASPSRRDLFRVIVHVDTEGSWIHNGPALPPTLLDLVLCDGVVQPLWTTEGLPINVGRRRRIVPPATRIVVEDRDRVCRHPTCISTMGLEVHHIVHWNAPQNGETNTENLCCLCRRHHKAHHRGEFTIVGNADDPGGLSFIDRAGKLIEPCGTPTPPGTAQPPAPPEPYQHPTGERLQKQWIHFSPPPVPPRDTRRTSEDHSAN